MRLRKWLSEWAWNFPRIIWAKNRTFCSCSSGKMADLLSGNGNEPKREKNSSINNWWVWMALPIVKFNGNFPVVFQWSLNLKTFSLSAQSRGWPFRWTISSSSIWPSVISSYALWSVRWLWWRFFTNVGQDLTFKFSVFYREWSRFVSPLFRLSPSQELLLTGEFQANFPFANTSKTDPPTFFAI